MRKKSLPVSRGAIRSGATSPTTSGTTGAGNRKTPSAPSANSATCSPSLRSELEAIGSLEAEYKLAIPPYYFSLIDPDDPHDPIRLQSVTSPAGSGTRRATSWKTRSKRTRTRRSRASTHRYPDRALLVTTHVCTMYCRFCTRKRATMVRGGWDAISRNDERMIEYVRDHPEIRDVIVSGGDPLTLPVQQAAASSSTTWRAIPHVDVIRIGTRVPVDAAAEAVRPGTDRPAGRRRRRCGFRRTSTTRARSRPEAARVCKALLRAGMPVNNHTVLLKGVNDDLETMRQLMRALLRIKVRPYYLFHCDPVIGAGHFRTSVWKGLEIMEGLRGHMSGLGIPTYVVDSPHGGGKIPLMPNYLVSASDDAVVLRNYEGMLVRYQAEDKPNTDPADTPTRGVSCAACRGPRRPSCPRTTSAWPGAATTCRLAKENHGALTARAAAIADIPAWRSFYRCRSSRPSRSSRAA